MEQDRIWEYFQNEGLNDHAFPEARQRFMLKYLKPGQAVLNIGVGNGALERLALPKGVDIHALDPSERAIKRLQEELALGDKARAGYAQEMPFKDAQFDAVVMCEVLEHLGDEILSKALLGGESTETGRFFGCKYSLPRRPWSEYCSMSLLWQGISQGGTRPVF